MENRDLITKSLVALLDLEEIEFDRTFRQLGVDSLDLLEVAMDVEEDLKVVIPDDDLSNLYEKTPNDFIEHVLGLVGVPA